MVIQIIALLVCLILLSISGIHVYWALGGNWGSSVVFPTKDSKTPAIKPGVIPTMIVAIGLFGMGLFVLIKGGFLSVEIPIWLDSFGLWVLAIIFIVRAIGDFRYVGFFKKIKETPFAINDDKYYSPLCLLIGIMSLLLLVLQL